MDRCVYKDVLSGNFEEVDTDRRVPFSVRGDRKAASVKFISHGVWSIECSGD